MKFKTLVLGFIYCAFKFSYKFCLITLRYIILWCVLKLLHLSKCVDHIVTKIQGDKQPSTSTSTTQKKPKGNTQKGRQRVKKSEDPSFSTSLKTPIERIIEETISEESSQENTVDTQNKQTTQTKNQNAKKKAISNPAQKKDIKKTASSASSSSSGSPREEDTAGFSLVKSSYKKKKSKGDLNVAAVSKKLADLPKSSVSIIDHYQPRSAKVRDAQLIKNSVSVVKVSTKPKLESVVESKRVEKNISYAKIAKQNLDIEENDSLKTVFTDINGEIIEEREENSFIFVENHLEKQKCEETKSTNIEETKRIEEDSTQLVNESLKSSISSQESQKSIETISTINSCEESTIINTFDVQKFEENEDDSKSLDSIEILPEEEINTDLEKEEESIEDIKTSKTEEIVLQNLEDVQNIVRTIIAQDTDNKNIFENIIADEPNIEKQSKNDEEQEILIAERNGVEEHSEEETDDKETPNKLKDWKEINEEKSLVFENQQTIISKVSGEIHVNGDKRIKETESKTVTFENQKEEIKEINTIKDNIEKHDEEQCLFIEDNIEIRDPKEEIRETEEKRFQNAKSRAFTASLSQKLTEIVSQETKLIETLNQNSFTATTSSFINSEISSEENNRSKVIFSDFPVEKLKMATGHQVRVLTLNDKEHQESTLYRIEKNWVIQFRLGPSLLGRKVQLYCNFPADGDKFNRTAYQLISWTQDLGCENADDTALFADITANISGSFHYYFTYGDSKERQGSGYFLVDPVLKYGQNEDLPLDCIQCQTVLAKNLGSLSTWENKLRVAKESGYNMIHFTPIQALGISNSCYSLSEQLKLNKLFVKENGQMPSYDEVEKMIAKIRKEWKITSICDIVLNHTANESEWLIEHPEATFNCKNCPYMRPAYLLDSALHQFSMDVKKGVYEDRGIPAEVSTEDHLNAIRYHFKNSVLNPLNIPELYICDVNTLVSEFLEKSRKNQPFQPCNNDSLELKLIQNLEYKRLATTVDMDLALKVYNVYRTDSFDEETRIKRCAEEFKRKLDSLNQKIIDTLNDHLNAAVENTIAGIRYFRVQSDGPKVREITINNPLVHRYFTDHAEPKSLKEHEEIMYSENAKYLMAHNGWVMNSDPLKNFALNDSNVYIRRELIAWGDSVKLNYGDCPEDNPYLWEHMRKYVEQTAKIFDGVRLDNCHSTPIPVAEYLLDCARRVRPDLYVVAELFTNSDMTDNIFVNRLGITSLIREAMSAWDSHEEGRLVYRYGGVPVGSFYQPSVRPLVPSIAHALFLDQTHDNPSPVEKRSVFDLLPSTALVNMACCASGSNRGYDELVPHHIHVVDEMREYTEWSDDEKTADGNKKFVTKKSGIIAAKRAINALHFKLGKNGFNQVYVDQMDQDIVAVTRHCPDTHQSYILVAFTAFSYPHVDADKHQRGIKHLVVEGNLDEIVLEATLSHTNKKFEKFDGFVKDPKFINGLSEYQVSVKENIQLKESDVFEKVDSGNGNVTRLSFKNFKPGSVVIIKVSLPEQMQNSVKQVRNLIDQFSITKETELNEIIRKMSLADLNRAIYRCDQEERDEGFGFGTYDIPNFGPMVYAGLQGFMSLLANIRPSNDLGHPMCGNLRDGNWMIDFIWKRLKLDPGTKELGQWIEENTKCFSSIPRYLVPCYFDVVVTGIYTLLIEQCHNSMSEFVKCGSTFVKSLSMGSVQFSAYIKSAPLPPLSPNLSPPKPPTRTNEKGEQIETCVTLSAGLPHFSTGYMRNWGRDTFIALRGLHILTGRFEEARQTILGYAACLRHGLIPNLLDGGRNSRFNCRDAVWWLLYCVKEYCEETPNGTNILKDKVSRIFPTDDSEAQNPGKFDQNLEEVIQEALNVHFQGLVFRERNAGRQIDEQMTDKGFNNQIGIHPETGFVFGGNDANCGTWMDKMGSSSKAGNKGKPATPRDGSAIELIGLSKAVVSWLSKLNKDKKYPYDGVERTNKSGTKTKWTFAEWSDKIQTNFEKYFWVNTEKTSEEIKPELINKRGIYKDTFGATQNWTDNQLRCNFPIAMVAAPELFNPQNAWEALKQAEKHLLGPLGMKTLDPADWAYNGDYDNSNDSDDFKLANGFNYHQGPEWVWPLGFFLRAKLQFAAQNGALSETISSIKVILSRHFVELQTSPWRGLPELTNTNGAYCKDSSRTQAWSMSCILEVLHDLRKIESEIISVN